MRQSDGELVLLARHGDIGGLATLLDRHRARLYAVALGVLGGGPDAEDVVHDAFLVAVARLNSLRLDAAASSWLAGITRNLALQRLRDRRVVPVDMTAVTEPPATDPGPEQALADNALADWVWTALGELSEPLQAAVVLRHFSRASSYQSIASVLGIPVGTVRSRLNEARRTLAHALLTHANDRQGDHAALVRARREFFLSVFDEYNAGAGCHLLVSALTPDAEMHGTRSADRGPEAIARWISTDLEAGMRLRVLDVIAGERITVVEGAFQNPPNDPGHCPPQTTQVILHRNNGISAIRLHYAESALAT